MKPRLIAALLLAASTTSTARAETKPEDKGVDAAFAVCNTIPFKDDKEHCQEAVNRADYFQPSLVEVCGEQYPHEVKAKCLAHVADKTAHETALEGCKEKKFWDDLSSCLGKITKPHAKPVAASPSPSPAANATCKKERVSDLINTAVAKSKKLQYLDLYDSLVQLRAQLTLCGFD